MRRLFCSLFTGAAAHRAIKALRLSEFAVSISEATANAQSSNISEQAPMQNRITLSVNQKELCFERESNISADVLTELLLIANTVFTG